MCLALTLLKHKVGEPAALHPTKRSVCKGAGPVLLPALQQQWVQAAEGRHCHGCVRAGCSVKAGGAVGSTLCAGGFGSSLPSV